MISWQFLVTFFGMVKTRDPFKWFYKWPPMFGDQKITHRITSLIWFNTWNSPRWGWKSWKPSNKIEAFIPSPNLRWISWTFLLPLKISLSKIMNQSKFYTSISVYVPPHPIHKHKKKTPKNAEQTLSHQLCWQKPSPPHPGLGSKPTIPPPQVRHSAHHRLVCPWRCCQRPSTCQSCSACRREDGTLPARFLGWLIGWLVLLGGWVGGWLVGWFGRLVGRLILRSWAFEMHAPLSTKKLQGKAVFRWSGLIKHGVSSDTF